MKAKEMILAFAEATGMAPEEVKVADRALADAGLRAKGRGPTPPEVTMQDVIRLLLGAYGSRYLSRANEYAADAARFAFLGSEIEPWPGDDIDEVMRDLLGFDSKQVKYLTLLDAFVEICRNLSRAKFADLGGVPTSVWVNIDRGGMIEIAFNANGGGGKLYFSGAVEGIGQPGVEVRAHVSPIVLRWIGMNFQPEAALTD
ncbi:MAG: hypothetical protein K8F59_02540 [Rhodobacteraceae bacterium]|nr:hypothetical protein [Paracoccaceae bacterium]